MTRLTPGRLLWIAAYVACLGLATWGMLESRSRLIDYLSSPEAMAAWPADRDELAKERQSGPVAGKVASTREPPALIMLRDHFWPILVSGLMFVSLMFGTVVVAVRAFRKPSDARLKFLQ